LAIQNILGWTKTFWTQVKKQTLVVKRHLFELEQDLYVQNIGNTQNFFDLAKINFGQAGHISI
jgi:hypothetical protein